MKEIAKMLRRLGPRYLLTWEWSRDRAYPVLIMTLMCAEQPHLGTPQFTCKHSIDADAVGHMDDLDYGARILEDMHHKIIEKQKEYWADK